MKTPAVNLILQTASEIYVTGSFNVNRFEESMATLEAALAAGKVYNVEFQDCKHFISRGTEHAQHIAAGHAHEREANGNVKFFGHGDVRNDIGYAFNMNQAAKMSRRLKKLPVASRTESIEAYIATLDQITEIWNWLQSFKTIIVKGRRPNQIKTEEQLFEEIKNTGLCPVCNGRQKLAANSNMVHHGYEMSEYNHAGQRIGRCFGCDYLPYEFSCEGNKQYIKLSLKPTLQAVSDALVRYQNQEQATLSTTVSERIEGKLTKVEKIYDKGTIQYERLRESAIRDLTHNINSLLEEIKYHQAKVKHWKLQPLKDGTTLNTKVTA